MTRSDDDDDEGFPRIRSPITSYRSSPQSSESGDIDDISYPLQDLIRNKTEADTTQHTSSFMPKVGHLASTSSYFPFDAYQTRRLEETEPSISHPPVDSSTAVDKRNIYY